MRKLTKNIIKNMFGKINPYDYPHYFTNKLNNFSARLNKKSLKR